MWRLRISTYLWLWYNLFDRSIALSKHPIVIFTAFDGFRYDYFSRGFTPILEEIANNGTKARFMMNQFPTITFPNFHSISTGMHVETHGVLSNEAFNEKNKCLGYGYELFHYNEEIIPLWNLNEMTGDGRHSGTMMWPGADFEYQNRRPTFYRSFNKTTSWFERVDQAVSWISHPITPVNLLYMYFEEPDHTGHVFGPESDELNDQLRRINRIVDYFKKQMSDRGLWERVNLLFLSDHGMATIKYDGLVDLDQILTPGSYNFCGFSPGLHVLPEPGFEDEIYENLTAAAHKMKTFQVYKPDAIPDRWFYKKNKRNVGFFVEGSNGYVFQDAKTLKGAHGYDNLDPKMHPMFFATGPLISKNHQVEPFDNIDLYPLVAFMLQLQMLPNHLIPNGTLNSNVMSMLNHHNMKTYEYITL